MSMIRINLIAERKAGAAKAVKKQTSQAGGIQEYLILIVFALLGLGIAIALWKMTTNELARLRSEEVKLTALAKSLEQWPQKKEEYEIQKELLMDQIKQISELKDHREGPVKLLEDINNVIPDSVWLESIEQGYDKALVEPVEAGRAKFTMQPKAKDKNRVVINGYASSQEAITNFANQILTLDSRYLKSDLNIISRSMADSNKRKSETEGAKDFGFSIYFDLKGVNPSVPVVDAKSSTSRKKKSKG